MQYFSPQISDYSGCLGSQELDSDGRFNGYGQREEASERLSSGAKVSANMVEQKSYRALKQTNTVAVRDVFEDIKKRCLKKAKMLI